MSGKVIALDADIRDTAAKVQRLAGAGATAMIVAALGPDGWQVFGTAGNDSITRLIGLLERAQFELMHDE